MTLLVIGAGIAGLTAAHELTRRGHVVRVVDKGRRPGGRLSTRRVLDADADLSAHASLAFDHGAQYFTVRDPRFAAAVEDWHRERVVQIWHGKLATFDSEGREAVEDDEDRWVGVPGMSAIGRHLARGVDLTCGVEVRSLAFDPDGGWVATAATGERVGTFAGVVVATPAPQAVPLVAESPSVATAVGAVRMHPCWAVMVAFDDRVRTPFDGAFVTSSPLGWVARDRSKPRRDLAETWVLHASGAWSRAHADDDPDAVGPFLLNAFADLVRAALPKPIRVVAHRWRYACADPALAVGALVDADRRLVVCGDWCLGSRVESAFLSGLTAAEMLDVSRAT